MWAVTEVPDGEAADTSADRGLLAQPGPRRRARDPRVLRGVGGADLREPGPDPGRDSRPFHAGVRVEEGQGRP